MRHSIPSSVLKSHIKASTAPIFSLRDAKVVGRFDLKHEVIECAIDLRGCEFTDEVDFRYCEFKKAVDLYGCAFRGTFNSGDEVESHTVYRKDLICNDTVFHSTFNLNGCQIEGSAFFSRATFSRTHTADFTTSSIGKTLECDSAVFRGPAKFGGMLCGSSVTFAGARFESAEPTRLNALKIGDSLVCDRALFSSGVDLELLHCEGGGAFRGTRFGGDFGVNFVQSSFGSNLECMNATFEGPAIFNSVTGKQAAFFQNAVFKCEMDASYASFGGLVDCSEASFLGKANFASLKCRSICCDRVSFEAGAIFDHSSFIDSGHFRRARFLGNPSASFGYVTFGNTADFSDAIFEGFAVFASAKWASNAFFHQAEFRGPNPSNFSGAIFGANLECQYAVFRCPSSFSGMICEGNAIFHEVRFEREIDFGYLRVRGTLQCSSANFLGDVAFGWSECRILQCRETSFNSRSEFNSVKCLEGAFFEDAWFRGDTNFSYMHCGVSLGCDRATFFAAADFDSLSCGQSGLFRKAFFQNADFRQATFGNNLNCNDALFRGSAFFGGITCGNSGFFRRAAFIGRECEVSWAGASFTGNLEFNQARFSGPVSLNRTACEGSAIFEDALLMSQKPARLEFSRFGRNLNFIGAGIFGPVDLTMAAVDYSLKLTGSSFRGTVALYETSANVVVLESTSFPFQSEKLDLRGFSFGRFEGSKETALRLAECQEPSTFTRDPYLQLEKHYQDSGDEVEAKRLHYLGRRDMRRNAKDEEGVTKWTAPEKWLDWGFKWLTGYGVRTNRLLPPIVAFLITGIIVFWPAATSNQEAAGLVTAFAYSADLLLPVVDVGFPIYQEPEAYWRRSYAVLHSLVGWVLVPLLVASLSGLIRRR